jgi:hypothetical protein
VTPATARSGILAAGLPEFVADQLLRIYAALRAGVASTPTGAVEALTGRPPRNFLAFARQHAGSFAAPAATARA